MQEQLDKINFDLSSIHERNRKVEADKAWETSLTRIFSILIITYILASIVLLFIGVKNYFLSALVPTLGYFLSTQSLSFLKKWWIKDFGEK